MHLTFFLAERRGASEIVATLIVFVITLAISAISVSFLTRRASLLSSFALQESEKVKLEQSTLIKILDIRKIGNKTRFLLYNPSDVAISVVAMFVNGKRHQVDVVLKPLEIAEVLLNLGIDECDINDIRLLTSEGALIHVKA